MWHWLAQREWWQWVLGVAGWVALVGVAWHLLRPRQSWYDRLGSRAIKTVIDVFYDLVWADPQLQPYFASLDGQRRAVLKRHLALMVGHALGGPKPGRPYDIQEAHQRFQITTEHYWRLVGHMHHALDKADAPKALHQTVMGILWDMKGDVISVTERVGSTA